MTVRKVYIGTRTPAVQVRVCSVDDGGRELHSRVLRHHVKHSPTGMEWGYGGSGPADLALSILVDALGPNARCPTCEGVGQLYWHADEGDFEANSRFTAAEREELARRMHIDHEPDLVVACFECERGVVRLPYQAFKFEVVAKLDGERWELPAADVLEWYRRRLVQQSSTHDERAEGTS